MANVLNKIALRCFDLLARRKDFSFRRAVSEQDLEDVASLSQGSHGDAAENARLPKHQKGVTRFVAYFKGKPVGTASLADLSLTGRAYSSYAVDETGKFFEIQELAIKGNNEAEERFILLGLFRQMYSWSKLNSIGYWHCNGARDVYMALRLYSKEVRKINIDFESVRNPFNQFLVTKCIRDAWFGLDVANLAPWSVLKRYINVRATSLLAAIHGLLPGTRHRKHGWSMG